MKIRSGLVQVKSAALGVHDPWFHGDLAPHHPRSPSALEWPDEPAMPEDDVAMLELKRQFWSKVTPPIYDVRLPDRPTSQHIWE